MSSVQSVERAFALLRCLSSGAAGVSELADRSQLPKSTVSRLLSTLQDLGVVEQLDAGGDYRIGNGLIDITAGASPGRNLVALARPHLTDLAEALGEATGLSVLDGESVYYLDQIDSSHAVQVRDWTGERVPLHVVSSGLVLLAALSEAVREAYLRRPLLQSTPRTMIDPDALRARLSAVAAAGVAWVYEEFAEGINSVAAPVHDAAGHVVAAIHAHGPSYRFPAAGQADSVATQVVDAADRASIRLAGNFSN
jgi:DNA-binding IclR family transcriptional regulator